LNAIALIGRSACKTAEMRQGPSDPIADNIRAIVDLERRALASSSWSTRVSDAISRFAGSLWFVLCHITAFVGWAVWNASAPRELRFDPYPYGLLTFIVSLEGVLIATFVLITQNRMAAQSDRRDHLNLQVDLLAEQEMTAVLRILRRIAERLEIDPESAEQARAEKLGEETNVYKLMQTLDEELPGPAKAPSPGAEGERPPRRRP
jgi:uncharacterized membrane protein